MARTITEKDLVKDLDAYKANADELAQPCVKEPTWDAWFADPKVASEDFTPNRDQPPKQRR